MKLTKGKINYFSKYINTTKHFLNNINSKSMNELIQKIFS